MKVLILGFLLLCVCVVNAQNTISTLAGAAVSGFTPDGPISVFTRFNSPHAIFFANGNVYIADTENHRIRMIDSNGTVIGD